ncbi:uncharacterized protein LOC122370300 [Amphibalanus amphitrite]|uniref:uncharacterized protein LOC122369221 n=1 Tax=Amphibalanus amphitrite TaxID=1232801 RepID=UPI001C929FFC|nr:uncharacterized protein LOC122369221 [Amphibalanus amphitrite]XP_043201705.1 uncharacterized protein LOC122370300 [Amphibalanus amphitrite]
MPKKTARCSLACDADQLKAKRAQYQSILSDLAQLDTDNDASRVLNYNKREVLQLLEQIRGAAPAGRGADTPVPGWLNVETMVGAVATGRPGGRAVGRARDEAITGLGHLFYMAGAQMTSVLDESLEALLSVLRDAESGCSPRAACRRWSSACTTTASRRGQRAGPATRWPWRWPTTPTCGGTCVSWRRWRPPCRTWRWTSRCGPTGTTTTRPSYTAFCTGRAPSASDGRL